MVISDGLHGVNLFFKKIKHRFSNYQDDPKAKAGANNFFFFKETNIVENLSNEYRSRLSTGAIFILRNWSKWLTHLMKRLWSLNTPAKTRQFLVFIPKSQYTQAIAFLSTESRHTWCPAVDSLVLIFVSTLPYFQFGTDTLRIGQDSACIST